MDRFLFFTCLPSQILCEAASEVEGVGMETLNPGQI